MRSRHGGAEESKTSRSMRAWIGSAAGGQRRSGQMLVLVAILMVALIASAGLVIEGGLIQAHRRHAQRAADAAAHAAAFEMFLNADAASESRARGAAISFA